MAGITYANPTPGGPPLHYGDPLPPGWAWTGLGPTPPMGNTPGNPHPQQPAPAHPDPTGFVAPGMADIFTADMKGWLATIEPGSFQFNSLPPMQKAWIVAYNAAAPPAPPEPRHDVPGSGGNLRPPGAHPIAAPITHDPTTPRPIQGGPVGEEANPPPGWYNSSLGGVPVHKPPPVKPKHTVAGPPPVNPNRSAIGGGNVVGPGGGAKHVGGAGRSQGGGHTQGYVPQPGPKPKKKNILSLNPTQRERVALRTILSALHAPAPDHTGIF